MQRLGALIPLAVLSARDYAGGKLFDRYSAAHAFLAETPVGFLVVKTFRLHQANDRLDNDSPGADSFAGGRKLVV